MTPDSSSAKSPTTPSATALTQVSATSALAADTGTLQRRRRWALLAAGLSAVALGAMLGQGLARSLATALPAAWTGSTGAWVGAAVAALLVPLSGWAAIRIVAPALPRRAAVAALTALDKAKAKSKPNGSDPQAPARDALTGAYTQMHFVAAADREWSRIRRLGEDAALLMVDIDNFKRLNDEQGMPCGDAMLVEITRQSSATLRPYDLLARFGGGVLVIYLPHTDLLGALDVAERIRERVTGLGLSWEGRRVKATVSVGVASVGATHAALDAVIADAGGALREAKEAGRNCVRAAPIPPKRNQASARSAGWSGKSSG